MKEYRGYRDATGKAHVEVIESGQPRALPPRHDLMNHSPTGFEWGYGGSGPAQLALAILADVTGDDALAVRLHHQFKFKVIGGLARSYWTMDEISVRNFVNMTRGDL
jgi:uncharacterized protein DUF6166